MHWNVGQVKITKVVELETVGSTRFILPLATNEEIRKLPWLICILRLCWQIARVSFGKQTWSTFRERRRMATNH